MKNTPAKKNTPGEILCAVYLSLLGVALPLTVHDAYFDITRTKATVFWLLAGAALLAAVLWLCFDREGRDSLSPLALPDWLFAVFALTHIVSTLLFRGSAGGLLAADNRFQGLLSFALYFGVFLLLRRFGRLSSLVRFALLLPLALASALGISEIFGADLLGLRAVSPEKELIRFLSTVGNVSFLGALCVLFLPLAAYFALSAEDRKSALPYGFCALLALCGGMAARTEAFVLGVLCFMAVLPLLCKNETALRRVPLLWTVAAAAALLFCLVMQRWAFYRPSKLTGLICSPALLLPFCLLSALAFLALRHVGDRRLTQIRKAYIILFWSLLAALAVFLILANALWYDRLPAALASVVVFSPSWGTDRGAEWVSFWQMFRSAPLPQKIIGGGAGSVAAWDRAHRLFTDAVTDSAHNEYLHYLLTGGIVGLGAYLALLVCAVRRALREPSRGRTATALACVCYAVQAAVNLAQPFTTPLFFALLALLLSDDAFEEKRSAPPVFWNVALCALAAALLVSAAAIAR
ncbi:MAG: O-antigen ligase family protein [Oscillospiraceae bacterium]|nr:O-antigen ligase family protein [Oscillospiraceae bacterium]